MPGNSDKKKVLALMFAVIGIVLLIVSLMLPWWGVHTKVESTGDYGFNYESGGGVSVASGIGYTGGGTSMYSGDFNTPLIFGVTTMFMILALVFVSLMAAYIIISLSGKNRNRKLPMMLGIFAIIFCILAPTIFMVALPGAMKSDAEKRAKDDDEKYEEPDHDDPTKSFFGEYKDEDDEDEITKTNWGGDIGWILSFVAFAMLLISVIFSVPKRSAFPPQQPTPQQRYEPIQEHPQLQAQQMQPPPQDQYYQDPPPQQYDQAPPPPPPPQQDQYYQGPPPQQYDQVPPPPPPRQEQYPPGY